MPDLPPMLCPTCWGAQQIRNDRCPTCHGAGVVPDEQLSEHFALSELLRSSTAIRLGLPNAPDAEQLGHLRRLATELLEPVRALVGPIHIDSGLRLPEVNRAVGGSLTSAHCRGLAADCVPLQVTRHELIARLLASDLAFDQVIHEGTWVHLGLLSPAGTQRRQALTAIFDGGRVSYQPYDPNDPRVQS